jgi:hypothetical protein
VLCFQGDAGGWDNLGAMDELRSAMLTTNEDIGTIDRLVRYSASSTNSTAVPAPTTLQARELRMYGPRGDPSCRPRRSQEHGLAAAASTQCNEEHSLGVAAKQAEESDEVSTPDEDTIDQEAANPSEEETDAGM